MNHMGGKRRRKPRSLSADLQICKIKPSHQKTWLCCRKPRPILFHFMHHWQPDSASTLFSSNVCTLISLLDWAYSAGRKLLFSVVKHTS